MRCETNSILLLITFFASFSAFNFIFSSSFLLVISFFLLSFDDDMELAELGFWLPLLADFEDVKLVDLVMEDTVYGLTWPNDDVEGLTLADCEFVLLISVAFDMMGATLELFMLSFFDASVIVGDEVDVADGSSSSGTFSDSFIAFDDDV